VHRCVIAKLVRNKWYEEEVRVRHTLKSDVPSAIGRAWSSPTMAAMVFGFKNAIDADVIAANCRK
jgi:mevalonate pyrophosphate decarboxylase